MKINILDAGLRDRAGHHFDYDLKLARHYADAGHDVHVYGFAGMADEVDDAFQKFGAVTRLISIYQYQKPSRYDWYAGELAQFGSESASITEDLSSVRQADVWIWPSLRAQEVAACISRGVDVPMVGCLHADPGVESRSFQAMLWRGVFLSARSTKLQLTLASAEAELRHRFMPIFDDSKFVIVPHPVDGPPIPAPKSALKRIGFFGHQREEKGHAMMNTLLSRLAEDGYAMTFQDSSRDGQAPDVPGVDPLGYVEDLTAAIAECDLVVLPYDVERYYARGSGILAECLALGIPVTAPVGTLPGRTIERFGVGPLFIANRADAIHKTIKAADRNYPVFAANAHRTAQQFSKSNGSARFASALLAAAKLWAA